MNAQKTLVIFLLFAFTASASDRAVEKPKSRGPASTQSANPLPTGQLAGERVLNIKGQSRNLNMMLILRGENDHVEFGETRKDYRKEVMQTHY